MRSFKKVLGAILAILFCVVLLSYLLIAPYVRLQDQKERQQLAGSIDFLVVGASNAQYGFSTKVLDEDLDVCSYNIASPLMPMYARYVMLEKEFERNPIKTVVLEISSDTLRKDSDSVYNEGDPYVLAKLDSIYEAISYLISYVSLKGMQNIYARFISYGVNTLSNRLQGNASQSQAYKGFIAQDSHDVILTSEDITRLKDIYEYDASQINQDNVDWLRKIIRFCHDSGAEVYVVVSVQSDSYLWQNSSLDTFDDFLEELCNQEGCILYDMNLDKERYSLYFDNESFMEETHLSYIGANAMTKRLCYFINCNRDGLDIETEFFSDYEILKEKSPYNSR